MKRSFHCPSWLLVVLALTCLAGKAGASTYLSFQSGPWSSPATWSAKSSPQPGDTVLIQGHTITLDCSASISILSIGDGYVGSLEFDAVGSDRVLEVLYKLEVKSGASLLSPYLGIPSHHELVVQGALVNNGTIYLSRNSTLPCDLVFSGMGAQYLTGSSSQFQAGLVRIAKGSDTASIHCAIPIQAIATSWDWYRGCWIQENSTLLLTQPQHVGPDCTVEISGTGSFDLRAGDLVVQGRVRIHASGTLNIGIEGQGSLILSGPALDPSLEMDGGLCTIHSGGFMVHRGVARIEAGLLSLSPQGLHGALPPGLPLLQVDSAGGLIMHGGMIKIIDPNVKFGSTPDIDIQTAGLVQFLGGTLSLGDNLSVNQAGAPFLIQSSVPLYQLTIQSGPRDVELLSPMEIQNRLDLISGQILCSPGQVVLEDSCLITRVEGMISCPPTLHGTVSVFYSGNGPLTTGPELPMIPTEVAILRVDVPQGLTLTQDLRVGESLELNQGVFDNDGAGNMLTCTIGPMCRVLRKMGSLTSEPAYIGEPLLEYAGTGPMDMGFELPSSGFVASMVVNHIGALSLSQDLRIRDSLVLVQGTLDLGSWTAVLDIGAKWSESMNSGVLTTGGGILADVQLVGGDQANPAGLGLDLGQPYGDCGWTRIVRTHESPMIGSHPGLRRVLDIVSADTPQPILATLHYTDEESGSIPGSQLMGYVSQDGGATWQADPGSIVDTSARMITYSEWTPPVMFSAGRIQTHPVELIAFTGRQMDDSRIRLHWRTATELNCDRFTVERLVGVTWEERGDLAGSGTCFTPKDYEFEDTLGLVVMEHVMYRLRQTDRDGTEQVYPEIRIAVRQLPAPSIGPLYPTCAQQELYCRLPGSDCHPIEVVIVDPLGRFADKILSSDIEQVGNLLILPIHRLRPGIYFVTISGVHLGSTIRLQQMFLKY